LKKLLQQKMARIPSHVPRDRVVDFDINDFSVPDGDYPRALKRLTEAGLPELLWTPRNGGHWIVTRAAEMEKILGDYEHFSSVKYGDAERPMVQTQGCPFHAGKTTAHPASPHPPLLPLEADPPEHEKYRKLIADAFAAKAVAASVPGIRAIAIELIDGFKRRGECEFFRDFAQKLTVAVFIDLVGLPKEDAEYLHRNAGTMLRGKTDEARATAFQELARYGVEKVKQHRVRPEANLISAIAHASLDGEPLDERTLSGMITLLVLGGFDTVASTLGFFARFLAENPVLRHQLVRQPELIQNATEELLRRFPTTVLSREVVHDFVYGGVGLRKGEIVMIPTALGGIDDRKFESPLEVDFGRTGPAHSTFGRGVHHCLGASLARAELRIFLEEWLKRIPDFQVKPGAEIKVNVRSVANFASLPLVWKMK